MHIALDEHTGALVYTADDLGDQEILRHIKRTVEPVYVSSIEQSRTGPDEEWTIESLEMMPIDKRKKKRS